MSKLQKSTIFPTYIPLFPPNLRQSIICKQDKLKFICWKKISTHYKRTQYLKKRFEFVEPIRIEIGKIRDKVSFYMCLPVKKTLSRLLNDKSLRKYMINDPVFMHSVGDLRSSKKSI